VQSQKSNFLEIMDASGFS